MALARRGELDRGVDVAARRIQRENLQQDALAVPTPVPFLTRLYLMLVAAVQIGESPACIRHSA